MKKFTHFYVDKTTQTFADVLVVFGLARVINDLHGGPGMGADVLIQDMGAYYQLECTPPLSMDMIQARAVPIIPIPAIKTAKNAESLPDGILAESYEDARELNNQYWAERKAGTSHAETSIRPHKFWDVFRAINPASLPGYNSLVEAWWQVRDQQARVLSILFDLFSQTPNDIDTAVIAWRNLAKTQKWSIKDQATCQQLYNPDQGKGQNKTKADGMSIGNQSEFWLLEWLKAVGFYEAAMTRLVRGAKDRKTFVIAPRELSYSVNRQVMSRFVDTMQSETSTRFDILAALRYAKALLEHLDSQPDLVTAFLRGVNLQKEVVAGFYTAFYKDLGNAVATMNLSFMALPGWIEINEQGDIQRYTDSDRGLLVELDKLTRQFDESHSDAATLLQHLRNFVSGDDLSAFFRFTSAFPAYYMGMRERGKYAYALSTNCIEELIMSIDAKLSSIVRSEGFQNIAYAIRQSTVTAQFRKGQGDRKYDVRYGLGQDLARQARYPDKFIAALTDFLAKYNAENAQVMERRSGPYRRSIQTADIDEIVALIDQHGSEVVANMLIAYGYARMSYEQSDQEEDTEMLTPEEEQE